MFIGYTFKLVKAYFLYITLQNRIYIYKIKVMSMYRISTGVKLKCIDIAIEIFMFINCTKFVQLE